MKAKESLEFISNAVTGVASSLGIDVTDGSSIRGPEGEDTSLELLNLLNRYDINLDRIATALERLASKAGA